MKINAIYLDGSKETEKVKESLVIVEEYDNKIVEVKKYITNVSDVKFNDKSVEYTKNNVRRFRALNEVDVVLVGSEKDIDEILKEEGYEIEEPTYLKRSWTKY